MQTRIASTQDINKESYLNSIADQIILSPGEPLNWGSNPGTPQAFGLAAASSEISYELDTDKVTRLNGLNNYSLSYLDMENAAKLNNLALGITISQDMSLTIQQSSNSTANGNTTFAFNVLTSVDSEPSSAFLQYYVVANNYITNGSSYTSGIGAGSVIVVLPTVLANESTLILFARSSSDERITSYAIYDFARSEQATEPADGALTLSPLNYGVTVTGNTSDLSIQNAYVFSFSYQENLSSTANTMQWSIPRLIDTSPFIILINGISQGEFFQEWVSYPQVPLKAGSNFQGSEQNVFSYLVTIKDTVYKVEITFGDVPS